jgi:AAA15 family ATPase/GTPase
MFKKITLKNYRTHKSTTLELQPITLLIGNNSSGKTNFLSGIQHFSELIIQLCQRPAQAKDYFPHRYCLANDDDAMSIEIEWSKNNNFVRYYMELYQNKKFKKNVGCKEKCEFSFNHSHSLQTLTSGYDSESNLLEINLKLNHHKIESLEPEDQDVLHLFFKDFQNTFSYHLQPSFLKVFFIEEKK